MSTTNLMLFLAGGAVCAITSYLVAAFLKKPDSTRQRIVYALISGVGSFALCWLASKYFPDRFDPWDSIPYSIIIGFLGIGRVLQWVAKRYGIEGVQTEKIDNEQGK
jgi:fluoride ion exporter CrcB/FEX